MLFGFAGLFTAVLLILSGLALDLVTETLAFLSGIALSETFAAGGAAFFAAVFAGTDFGDAGLADDDFAGAGFTGAGFAATFDFAAGFAAVGLPFAGFAAGAAFFAGFACFFGAGFGAGFLDFAFGAALAVVFFAISISCEISALTGCNPAWNRPAIFLDTTPLSECAHATR